MMMKESKQNIKKKKIALDGNTLKKSNHRVDYMGRKKREKVNLQPPSQWIHGDDSETGEIDHHVSMYREKDTSLESRMEEMRKEHLASKVGPLESFRLQVMGDREDEDSGIDEGLSMSDDDDVGYKESSTSGSDEEIRDDMVDRRVNDVRTNRDQEKILFLEKENEKMQAKYDALFFAYSNLFSLLQMEQIHDVPLDSMTKPDELGKITLDSIYMKTVDTYQTTIAKMKGKMTKQNEHHRKELKKFETKCSRLQEDLQNKNTYILDLESRLETISHERQEIDNELKSSLLELESYQKNQSFYERLVKKKDILVNEFREQLTDLEQKYQIDVGERNKVIQGIKKVIIKEFKARRVMKHREVKPRTLSREGTPSMEPSNELKMKILEERPMELVTQVAELAEDRNSWKKRAEKAEYSRTLLNSNGSNKDLENAVKKLESQNNLINDLTEKLRQLQRYIHQKEPANDRISQKTVLPLRIHEKSPKVQKETLPAVREPPRRRYSDHVNKSLSRPLTTPTDYPRRRASESLLTAAIRRQRLERDYSKFLSSATMLDSQAKFKEKLKSKLLMKYSK